MRRFFLSILLASLLVGCGDDDNDNATFNAGIDAGGRVDTGSPNGDADGGPGDAGDDAGGGDAGLDDAGMPEGRGLGPDATFEGFAVDPMLVVAPNPDTPLVAELTFQTTTDTTATVTLDDGESSRTLAFAQSGQQHSHLLLELYADTVYDLTLEASDGAEVVATATGTFSTEPLSDLMPATTTAVSDPSRMEPGLTLYSVRTSEGGVLIAADSNGEPVWVHFLEERLHDTRQLESGNFLVGVNNRMEGREITPRGDIANRWVTSRYEAPPASAAVVETDSFHHEFARTAAGDYLALSSEARSIVGYPISEEDQTPRTEEAVVVADVIVRFDEDGTILNEVNLFDVLDTGRVSYDGFGGYWNRFYTEWPETFDWTHANGVVIDPADDAYIVTLKHQNAIVKITQAGEVVWILAPPYNWEEPLASKVLTPQGPEFSYSYHIHAPEVTDDGTLMIFDNHKYGTSPPTPPLETNYSRGIEYRIDETNMTVEQVWVWDGAQDGLFAPIVGDTNVQPTTNNVLMTFGGILPDVEGVPSAHIIEVTRPDGEKVFELVVEDDNDEGPADRTVYRALRIPSLYPQGVLQ